MSSSPIAVIVPSDDPNELFECAHLHAKIRRAVCVQRQAARFHKGGPVYPHCGTGQCAEGKLVKIGLGKWTVPEYGKLRSDFHAQKRAKAKFIASIRTDL